jgi:hypothetical protein
MICLPVGSMIAHEHNTEKFSERSVQEVFAAFPFLVHPGDSFVDFDLAPQGSPLKIDLCYTTPKGSLRRAEVEWGLVDLAQIVQYEKAMDEEIRSGQGSLCWLIPQGKSGSVQLPANKVCIHRFDEEKIIELIRLREDCARDLARVASLLSSPFTYLLGKSIVSAGEIRFPNVIDALYFYGYLDPDPEAEKPKRRKVGFHLGTLGWSLDLIRNVASTSPFAKLYPELSMMLVLEILEAPFRFEDVKSKGGRAIEEGGLITLVRHFKKGGTNWDSAKAVFEEIEKIADSYRVGFRELSQSMFRQDALRPAGLAFPNLLEVVAKTIPEMGGSSKSVSGRELVNLVGKALNLSQTRLTETVAVAVNRTVVNTRAQQRNESSDIPSMAKRVIELMVLHGLLLPRVAMYPEMRTLRYGVDLTGKRRLEIVPVATFKPLTDLDLRQETVRESQPEGTTLNGETTG